MLELFQLEVANPTQSVVRKRGNTLFYFSKKPMGRFLVKAKSKIKIMPLKKILQKEGLDAGQAKIIDAHQYSPDDRLMTCTYMLQDTTNKTHRQELKE